MSVIDCLALEWPAYPPKSRPFSSIVWFLSSSVWGK